MLRFVVESKLKKYEKFTGYRFNSYNIYGAKGHIKHLLSHEGFSLYELEKALRNGKLVVRQLRGSEL